MKTRLQHQTEAVGKMAPIFISEDDELILKDKLFQICATQWCTTFRLRHNKEVPSVFSYP